MIRFVIGHPGAGKTLFCVSKIVDELVYTDRFVVTNITELKLARLGEYLAQKFPRVVVDLDERLLVIPREDTFHFWRYRSGGLVLPDRGDWHKLPLEQAVKALAETFRMVGERPEWMRPVSYFLSEAHEYFPAKDWDQVGRPVKYYASKHRHLHDEVIVETQFPEQVEPNFRRLAQEFHRLQNMYTMSFGPFRRRGGFVRKVYLSIPTRGSVPYETVRTALDASGVASCYNTTGALGIMQRGPESTGFGRKTKLPWWSVWVMAVGGLAAIVMLMWAVPTVVETTIRGVIGGAERGLRTTTGTPAAASQWLPARVPSSRGTPAAGADAVQVLGYALVDGGRPRVWLSDGRMLTEADSIAEIRPHEVVMRDGTRYAMRYGAPTPPKS